MSKWAEVQEVNGCLNIKRREITDTIQFLNSLVVDDDNNTTIAYALGVCRAMDQILSESYLDSGYAYDDQDPRNIMDTMDDNWFEREDARNGTNAEAEMRMEIQRAVVANQWGRLEQHLNKLPGYSEWYCDRQAILFEMHHDEWGMDDHQL